MSVIVLGTDQSHAHVRSIECARLCDHGIAIRRTRQRHQACEGQRRQGNRAGGSFTTAALIRMKGGAPLFSAAPYHAARWPHVSCGMLLPSCAARPGEPCGGDGNDRPLVFCPHSAFIRGDAWLRVPTSSVLWLTGLLRRMRTGKMRPQLRGDETLRSSDGVCRLATLAPLAGLAGRTRNGRWLSMPRTPAWRSGVCGLTGRLVRLQA